VGPISRPAATDVVPPCWRPGPPWSKPPTISRISEAARYHRVRPDCRRAVAAMVEAAHCQSDLRGHPLPPHATRDPTAAAPSPLWSKPLAAKRISEAARCHRVRPDHRRVVVVVVEAAHRAMVASARLGGGRERRAATALVLVIIVVLAALVNDHLLLLEHGPLRVGDGGRGGTMATSMVGMMGTTSRPSYSSSSSPCPTPPAPSCLSCSEKREKERTEDEK
jgi:hypothetical protein